MFSGIVEETARIISIEHELDNVHLTMTCSFVQELTIDQSVAHNGVCLTVVRLNDANGNPITPLNAETAKQAVSYTVTAMRETLDRSNIGLLKVGDEVNVERSMMMNGRLDGHIVQGHVDQTAVCLDIEDQEGSYQFTFHYPFFEGMAERGYFTVDKGSCTVNGVSLTVCEPTADTFKVCIIPYTYENTNFHSIEVGSVVNIEFDIIGKYIARMNHLIQK